MTINSCKLSQKHVFDIKDDAERFNTFLLGLASDSVIAVVTIGDAERKFDKYEDTLTDLFGIEISRFRYDDGYSFIGKIGDASFTRFRHVEGNDGIFHLAEIIFPFTSK